MPSNLIFVIFALLCGGCSTQMAREGWAFRTSPVGASQTAGYSDPVATKTKNGGITFQYDGQVVHYGMLGHWGPPKVIGMQRLTNFVAVASLRPATNFWRLSVGTATCPVESGDTNGIASGVLSVLEYHIGSDGHIAYPSRECILWVGDWVWYVPPQHDGDIPMAAVVSTDTTRTPGYIYPIRMVLFQSCWSATYFTGPWRTLPVVGIRLYDDLPDAVNKSLQATATAPASWTIYEIRISSLQPASGSGGGA